MLVAPAGLVGCGDDNGAAPATDTTPPTVQSVFPVQNATGVSVNTKIQVTFSEPVLASSVTAASFDLQGVSGTLSVSGATATFTPTLPLAVNTQQTCAVHAGVQDMAGNALAADYDWSFTTGAQPVAHAGNDIDVSIGDAIDLDGTASFDPDGAAITSWTWTQVSGPSVTLMNGNTASPSVQTPPADVSTLEFDLVVGTAGEQSGADRVVVRILEDAANALWVSATGNDADPGTRNLPMATVQAAVDAAAAGGVGADVYVGAATYAESIVPASGVSIYGGFDALNWTRDVAANVTALQGGARAMFLDTVADLTIDGLTVQAADATNPGESSVAIGISQSTGIVLTRNRLFAGAAADGAIGADGLAGANGSGGSSATSGNGASPGYGPGHSGGWGGSGGQWADGYWGSNGYGPIPGSAGAGGTLGGNGGAAFGAVGLGGYTPGDGADAAKGGSGCGGGGAGASGGGGGQGGGGGGGSFAILLTNASEATIHDNAITTGSVGAGAVGGLGMPGGTGGSGGGGASPTAAGDGGSGGSGGGGGGPSYGVVESAGSTTDLLGNTFTIGTPGVGAAGPGGTGANALSGDTLKL